MVIIPPNDARSVTVPIFAKRAGKVQVEVSAVFQNKMFRDTYINNGGDTVRRELLVVVSLSLQWIFFACFKSVQH